MVSEKNIRNVVSELGLSGQSVCLHVSLRSFGHLEGGADALLNAFLSEECTVIVPTFSDSFSVSPPADCRPFRNGWDYGKSDESHAGVTQSYTPASYEITEDEMGMFAAAVLTRKERIRGDHPLCSFSGIGSQAESLICDQTPSDVFAPLKKLSEIHGSILLIGVGLEKMTFLHLAEELAGRNPFVRWANDCDGYPIGVRVGGCSEGFGNLESTLSSEVRFHTVGSSKWQVYPADSTLVSAVEAIRNEPRITHCGNPECERCQDAIKGGPGIVDSKR